MVFGKGFDEVLWLILSGDKSNRLQIAKLVSSLPSELIYQIQMELRNRNNENLLEEVEFSKVVKVSLDEMSLFKVKMSGKNIRIKLSKWKDDLEEVYDLDLVSLPVDKDLQAISLAEAEDDIVYIGSFFESNSSSVLGIGPVIVESAGSVYELYINLQDKAVVQISDDHLRKKIVDMDKMPSEIEITDLKNNKSINRLVRERKRDRL